MYRIFQNSAEIWYSCTKTDNLTVGTIPMAVPTLNNVFKYFTKKTPNFYKENKKDFFVKR